MTPFATLQPVQVAYHVPDPGAAAERFARSFGWGPFFLMEHIALKRSLHHGRPEPFDHSSAYGQAGEVMVELITQHNEGPSALRDRYAADETGDDLLRFYAFVRKSAAQWDGSRPLRR